MKNFLRILYVLFFITVGLWVFTHPLKTETNLLKAVFSNSSADETVVLLSGRYSAGINVLVEAPSQSLTFQTAEKFYNSVNKDFFKVKDFDFLEVLSE